MASGPGAQFVEKTASRLKFPQAFAFFVVLFVVDVIIPDFIPFIDEILLGLAAAIFGMWRERVSAKPPAAPAPDTTQPGKPPIKNVTPGD